MKNNLTISPLHALVSTAVIADAHYLVHSKRKRFSLLLAQLSRWSLRMLVAAGGILVACQGSQHNRQEPATDAVGLLEGKQLALTYCQSCHLLPTPDLVDKKTWQQAVFPRMGPFLGIHQLQGPNYMDMRNAENGHLFPSVALLPEAQWEQLKAYYVHEAPVALLPAADQPAIRLGLRHFTPRFPALTGISSTTLVKIDSTHQRLYVGDGRKNTLSVLSQQMHLLNVVPTTSAPVHLRVQPLGLTVLAIGSMNPSDSKKGTLTQFNARNGKLVASDTLLQQLPRSVYATYADVNADGREDVIICGFGNYVGYLAWYENKDSKRFEQHLLKNVAGAVQAEVKDFNGDGRPDIMALMAQGNEGIDIYYNEGSGNFREERVLNFSPSYGSNSFQIIDFNRDGYIDILYTNGDNGDYPPILKPYHGVRIFLNDGKNHFKQAYFYPIHGVGKAVAVDFDQDGDVDLAAISYFPDFNRSPHESFVYLENQGQYHFQGYSFPESSRGRWLVLDTGDLDNDGDIDIALGTAHSNVGNAPAKLKKSWAQAPPIVILENTIKPTAELTRNSTH